LSCAHCIVAEDPHSFGRGETTYDTWHYGPVLVRKPGALRNGALFRDWVLPAAIERVRRKLADADDGRQTVDTRSNGASEGSVLWTRRRLSNSRN
jgi:hypothetical protein